MATTARTPWRRGASWGRGGDNGFGLAGWVRAGLANGQINPIANYLGGGLVYTGLIKGRDKDEIGLAIARAGFGSPRPPPGPIGNGQVVDAAETDLEATYRYAVKDWLNVQPDIQYVIDPHGESRIPNAFVLGLRIAFTYTR